MEYIRNYPKEKALLSDPLVMKGWPEVFGTRDKEEVEKELQGYHMNYEWGVR